MKFISVITFFLTINLVTSSFAMTARDLDQFEHQKGSNAPDYGSVGVFKESDCDNAATEIKSLYFHIKMQEETIKNLCNLKALNNCTQKEEQEIIASYQNAIQWVTSAITKLSNDVLKKACSFKTKDKDQKK